MELVAYSSVLEKGRASTLPHVPPAAKDTATIMYTSGTTVSTPMFRQRSFVGPFVEPQTCAARLC